MTAFEAYKLYLALRQHFERDSYDFVKYHGSTNAKQTSFDVRKDKYMFHKLSKQTDPKALLVANLVMKPSMWVGDLLAEKAKAACDDYLARQGKLGYWFSEWVKKFDEDLDVSLAPRNNRYPILVTELMTDSAAYDGAYLLNSVYNFIPFWESEYKDDPLASDAIKRLKKYARLHERSDSSRIEAIAKNHFQS